MTASKIKFREKALTKSAQCIECESDLIMTKDEVEATADFIAELLLKNYLNDTETKISLDK